MVGNLPLDLFAPLQMARWTPFSPSCHFVVDERLGVLERPELLARLAFLEFRRSASLGATLGFLVSALLGANTFANFDAKLGREGLVVCCLEEGCGCGNKVLLTGIGWEDLVEFLNTSSLLASAALLLMTLSPSSAIYFSNSSVVFAELLETVSLILLIVLKISSLSASLSRRLLFPK